MNERFTSIAELIDFDDNSAMDVDEFDTALWLLLCDKITSPDDLQSYELPVRVYYASRLLQWEVGNGGFAQAAYNIPEWFALAADGYKILGKPKAAQLIQDAMKLLPHEQNELKQKGLFAGTIGEVFAHFRQSRMAALDERIPEDEWEIDHERVAYVRKHRDAFRLVT